MKRSHCSPLRRLGALTLAIVMVLGATAAAGYAFLLRPAADTKSSSPAGCAATILAQAGLVGAILGSGQITLPQDAVVEKQLDFDENIMLSIFWPPTPDYINDEQYRLMAEAGINWVMGAGEETLATKENQQKMLDLCAKYGMNLIVQDGTFGGSLISKKESTIANQVAAYKDAPALGGFYILDEPFNPNQYVDAYMALKKAFPDG